MILPIHIVDGLVTYGYADSSVKIVDYCINKIITVYLNDSIYDINILSDKLDYILDMISNEPKTSIKKSMINSLLRIFVIENRQEGQKLEEEFKKICTIRDDDYKYKSVNRNRFVTLEDINECSKMCTVQQCKILILLYSTFPALRGQDYCSLKLIKVSQCDYIQEYTKLGHNFIDIDTYTMVIGDHKTQKTHGVKIITFPLQLHQYLKAYIDAKSEDDYFIHENNKQFIGNKFTVYLNKLFELLLKKKISVDDLRKIYVAEMVGHLQEYYTLDIQKKYRQKMANIMGHCLSTQEFAYSGFKYDKMDVQSSYDYMQTLVAILDSTSVELIKV